MRLGVEVEWVLLASLSLSWFDVESPASRPDANYIDRCVISATMRMAELDSRRELASTTLIELSCFVQHGFPHVASLTPSRLTGAAVAVPASGANSPTNT